MATSITDSIRKLRSVKTGAEAWVLPLLGVAVFSLVLERFFRGYLSSIIYDSFLVPSYPSSTTYYLLPLGIAAAQGILTGMVLVYLAPRKEKNRIQTTRLVAMAVGVYYLIAWVATLITLLMQTRGVVVGDGNLVPVQTGITETFLLVAPALTSALAICVAPFLANDKE